MPLTKPQAEALTMLAIAARPSGARRWDGPGVIAALAKVAHLDLANVVMATMRAAADRNIETPGVIANTSSSCWRERVGERTGAQPPKREEACLTCGRYLDACTCGERRTRPHQQPDPATTAEHIARLRAQLRGGKSA